MKKRANFLFIEKDGANYVISMTPELQDDVGTVGFVEFTSEDHLDKDDAIANIEASKTVMEIQSPLAGTVVEKNTAAEDQAELLNSAKAEENWLIKLTDVDEEAFAGLEDA